MVGGVLKDCKLYMDSGCGYELKVFLFGTYGLKERFPRVFYSVISGLFAVYYGTMILASLAACCWCCCGGGSNKAKHEKRQEQETKTKKRKRRRVWPTLRTQRAYYTRFTPNQYSDQAFLLYTAGRPRLTLADLKRSI